MYREFRQRHPGGHKMRHRDYWGMAMKIFKAVANPLKSASSEEPRLQATAQFDDYLWMVAGFLNGT
jgi:hypothetical protein